MISDQGLAMIRDGIVIASEENEAMLQVVVHEKGTYQPAVVVERNQINYGKSFRSDVMLVSLTATRPKAEEAGVSKFQYVDVYNYCQKNGIFPSKLDQKILTQMLRNPQR